jgi:type I restriction enzyme R subunit
VITPYNENSRVKIPALVHFARLGYQYASLKDYQGKIDADTNIFIDTFLSAINRINHTSLLITDAEKIIAELKIALAADDLGRSFFSYLLAGFCDLKLIDLEPENYQNNIFQIVTELTYRSGNDEFRPDITVLINGLPLAFVEVKKPNNKDGIQAEYTRMNIRAQNKKLRRL